MHKPFVLLLIVTFQLSPVIAQSKTPKCVPREKTDRELAELRGQVKSINTYKAWYMEDEKTGMRVEGKRELEEEALYDKNGGQTKWRNVNYLPHDPKSMITANYVCDANNRIAEVRYARLDGSLTGRTTYAYDPKGRKIEMAVYSPEGTLERKETYGYDKKGNLSEEITTQHIRPEHFTPKRNDVYATTKDIYKYDDKRNKIEHKALSSNGSLYAIWTYNYDSKNRMTKHTRIDEKGRIQDRYVYKYDGKGKLTEEIHYSNFCYYRDGQMCEGSVNSGDGIFYYATKTIYEYDRKANWIKRSEFSMGDEKSKGAYEPDTVMYRQIKYY
jgi:hypothetical protein